MGQVETCSCSLQPLGGLHRLEKFLSLESSKNKDILFFSTGGLFNDKTTPKEALKILDFEKQYAKNAALLRDDDLDFLTKKKLPLEKEKFMVLGEDKQSRLGTINTVVRPLDNVESYNKIAPTLASNTLNIFLSEMPLTEITKLAPPKDSVLEVFLGSSSSNADEFKCFSRHQRLFCQGGQKGRYVARLKFNISNLKAPWLDLKVLKFNAEGYAFFKNEKESEDQKAALKSLIEGFPKDWKTSNFFTLESVYMNNNFDN